MNIKITKREWIIGAVLIFVAAYFFLGKIITTALLGVAGGAVIGANLPASWRARLILGVKKGQTITVPPATPPDPTKH